jgi:hypothetical protein
MVGDAEPQHKPYCRVELGSPCHFSWAHVHREGVRHSITKLIYGHGGAPPADWRRPCQEQQVHSLFQWRHRSVIVHRHVAAATALGAHKIATALCGRRRQSVGGGGVLRELTLQSHQASSGETNLCPWTVLHSGVAWGSVSQTCMITQDHAGR